MPFMPTVTERFRASPNPKAAGFIIAFWHPDIQPLTTELPNQWLHEGRICPGNSGAAVPKRKARQIKGQAERPSRKSGKGASGGKRKRPGEQQAGAESDDEDDDSDEEDEDGDDEPAEGEQGGQKEGPGQARPAGRGRARGRSGPGGSSARGRGRAKAKGRGRRQDPAEAPAPAESLETASFDMQIPAEDMNGEQGTTTVRGPREKYVCG